MPRGLWVEGRVLDEQGRPIAGVRFDDVTRGLDSREHAWCHPTDGEGRFHIPFPPGRILLLAARAKGYSPLEQKVAPDPDHPDLEYRLSPGKRLRVRVVDSEGHPIPGAMVSLFGHLLQDRSIRFHTWTDPSGRFGWDDAPGHPLAVSIHAEGYLPSGHKEVVAGQEATITLQPAVDVRLVAVDARTGEAIPRFRVEIGSRQPGTDAYRWGPRMGRSAPWKFEIVLEAENGPYHFRISADGYAPARILVPSTRTVLRKAIKLEKVSK
jgi:hypothetical protein